MKDAVEFYAQTMAKVKQESENQNGYYSVDLVSRVCLEAIKDRFPDSSFDDLVEPTLQLLTTAMYLELMYTEAADKYGVTLAQHNFAALKYINYWDAIVKPRLILKEDYK